MNDQANAPAVPTAGFWQLVLNELRAPPQGPRFAAGFWFFGGGSMLLLATGASLLVSVHAGRPIEPWQFLMAAGSGSSSAWGVGLVYYHFRFYSLWGYERDLTVLRRTETRARFEAKRQDLWTQYMARTGHYSRRFGS